MRWALPAIVASALSAGTARGQSALASPDLAAGGDIVVTASRSGDPLDRGLLGSSATVIGPETLAARQVRLVSDVLRDVPGVAVSRTGAVGGLTDVRIRGTEANQVLVLIDGIKADDPYQGSYDFGGLIADDAARIEVLRGQQSALYGSDAIGGVIAYTTLSGREAPGTRLMAEGGSFGTVDGTARMAGVAGDLDYALSGAAQHDRGFPVAPGGRRDVGATLAAASAKANWTPAAGLRITLVGRYNRARADSDDQGTPAEPPTVAGRVVTTAIDSPGTAALTQSLSGLGRVEIDGMAGALTTAASAQATDDRRDGFDGGAPTGDRGARQRYSLEEHLRLERGAAMHRLTLALDAEREAFRNTTPGPFVDREGHALRTIGLVGQYRLAIGDHLGLGASLRHDWNSRFADATTWHLDGSWRLAGGTRLHAAAGSGIKDPAAFELFGYADGRYIGNPGLQPEQSRGWEAGFEQTLFTGHGRIGATWFHSRLHDEIYTTYDGPDFTATSRNRDGATTQEGVEAVAALTGRDLRLDATYTFLHAPQSRDVLASAAATLPTAVTMQAVRRAKHLASLNLSYAPATKPFSATLTARYTGRQSDVAYTPAFEALYVGLRPYTLVNLAITYAVSRQLQLFGRVENLLDRRYQEVFGYAAPGRAAYGGVRLRL